MGFLTLVMAATCCFSAFAVNYGGKYGTIRPAFPQTLCGERDYLLFNVVAFGNNDVHFVYRLYSDKACAKQVRVDAKEVFSGSSQLAFPVDLTSLTSGTYYVKSYVSVLKDGTWHADESTLTTFTVQVNRGAAFTSLCPVFKEYVNTASGPAFSWYPVKGAKGYAVYRKNSSGKWVKLSSVKTTSYTDSSLARSSGTYFYTVRAYSDTGVSSYLKCGFEERSIPKPTLISARLLNDNIVRITWYGVSNVSGYRIYRRVSGGSWQKIGYTSSDYDYYDDTSAKVNGTTYQYTVRAKDSKDISSFDSKGVLAELVAAPRLTSVKASIGGNTVTWNKVVGATGYRVYRRTPDAGSWTFLGTASASDSKYTDKKAAAAGSYYYTVRSVKNELVGSYSDRGIGRIVLTKPVLQSAAQSGRSVVLKWKAVRSAQSYNIYLKTVSGWQRLASNVTKTAYTYYPHDPNAVGSYTFTVVAVCDDVRSGYDTVGITAAYAPALTVSTSLSKSGCELSWNAITGAESYNIYRRSGSSAFVPVGNAKVASFTDVGLLDDVLYAYRVEAVKNGKVISVNTVLPSVKKLSAAVQGFSASVGENRSIFLSWSAVSGAAYYRVYVLENGVWVPLEKSYTTDCTVEYAGTPGTTAEFSVAAFANESQHGLLGQAVASVILK